MVGKGGDAPRPGWGARCFEPHGRSRKGLNAVECRGIVVGGFLKPSHEARPGQPVDALGATCFRTDGAASLPFNRQRAGAALLSGSVLVLWIVATGRHSRKVVSYGGVILATATPAGRNAVMPLTIVPRRS
jgi:hypothetical protein